MSVAGARQRIELGTFRIRIYSFTTTQTRSVHQTSNLKMMAECSFETLVMFYHTEWHHIQEDKQYS
jgi:hypothetical protein